MNDYTEYMPFLIPLAVLEIVLALVALVHVLRHPHYRFGNRPLWILIVVLVQIIGPVVYFAFGRGDE
ncbi:MAG: PLD nuclease N-terminal domain-containing protein [Clostridiales Family XIII bacterium]|uniref:PLDc N-terminal domain-containing protein n=1 Tax=Hominibacterium faecale TaxID=2839743 RepID=UPI0022B29840|nr:PLD nuclease N-terminal domain-containing protein [Hominibacterium faecale]MCI7301076.1 PLD nuclease N-terminal domain-containing protein [Clostridia bacterium]MDY3012706.1 PLD nuclease N-terminal domain-containing protein [Clostridiales Family XIII bacterium]